MDLAGKVVAITGGANGIGRALSEGFATRGARVAIGDLDGAGAAALAETLQGFGARLDVASEHGMSQFLAKTERALGPVDIVVSNAGVGVTDGPLWDAASAPNESWLTCWNVNLMASVYAARHTVPGMIARGGGVFIIVASAAGLLNQIGDAPYSVTKAAAVSFAESLAITHGDAGLQVHCVCPEGVRTNLIKGIEDGAQGLSGYIEPSAVAEAVFAGMDAGTFRIFTHPNTQEFAQLRLADADRWLGGMRKLRRSIIAKIGRPM